MTNENQDCQNENKYPKFTSFNEILADLKNQKAKKFKEHPIAERIRDLQCFIERNYWQIKHEIKEFFHKLRYGFRKDETWSLDVATAKWLVPRLKHLRKVKHGIPSSMFSDCGEHSDEQFAEAERLWNYRLDLMIWAFENIAAGCAWDWDPNDPRFEKIKVALTYFKDHYFDLWD